VGGALVLRVSSGSCWAARHPRLLAGRPSLPERHPGAAFGWLALGVQFGTALSPLATGGLAR